MKYAKKTVRGTVTVTLFALLAGVIAYLIRLVLARSLTPEEYGLFYAVYSFLAIFAIFRTLGLDEALVKYIPGFLAKQNFSKIKSIILYSVGYQFLFALVIFVLLFFLNQYLTVHYFRDPKAAGIYTFLLLSFLLMCLGDIWKFVFQGLQRMVLFASVNFSKMLLVLILIIVLLQFQLGIMAAAYAYFLVYLILPLVYFIIFRRQFREIVESAFVYDKRLVKKMFAFGVPVTISLVGYLIIEYTDVLTLTYFKPLLDVGLYNAAIPTSKLLFYLGGSLSIVLFPMIAEIWAKNRKQDIQKVMDFVYRYAMLLMIPLGLLIFAFPEIVIRVLFGEQYLGAVPALQILSLGYILFTLFQLNSAVFLGSGKPKIVTQIVLTGALLNLVLNLILIPSFSIVGAALATMVSYGVLFFLSAIWIRRYVPLVYPWFAFFKIVFSSMIFIACISLLKEWLTFSAWIELLISVGVASFVYLLLVYLFGILSIQETKMLVQRVLK